MTSEDNSTLRFEVRKGDQYVSSGYTDSVGVERAEMGDVARYSINQDISVEYKFMIEPGAKNTAKWMVMGQLHSAMNMSPPIEIKFNGNDKMKISGNSGSTGNPVYRDIYSDSQDIVRGHWYTMKMNIKFDPYGNGSAEIWRDGVQDRRLQRRPRLHRPDPDLLEGRRVPFDRARDHGGELQGPRHQDGCQCVQLLA